MASTRLAARIFRLTPAAPVAGNKLHNTRPQISHKHNITRMHSSGSNPAAIARLASKIPKGTWCSHMHIVDPANYPLSANAKYIPEAHTLNDAQAFLHPLGIEKMVIVQPSIYGNDNACTLSGLPDLGPSNGRAVIQFDPDQTSSEQLQQWHEQGVRGVRLNFKSVGAEVTGEFLESQLLKYASAVRPYDWVIELYIAVDDIPHLLPVMPKLDSVKICIDHLGHPSATSLKGARSANEISSWGAFTELLSLPNVWCKLSATYRLSDTPDDPLVRSMCKSILEVTKGERCVFATDWPHTRFENVDVVPFLDALIGWIEDSGISIEKILKTNGDLLWDA